MYSDAVRSGIVAKGGLKVLTEALASPSTKTEMKAAAAKALVNLSLNDETEDQFVTSGAIAPLVRVLEDSKSSQEFQSLASMCLENLSYNHAASDAIREAGGIDIALKCLGDSSTTPAIIAMQERSVKLLSKLAINGRNRKHFQDRGGAELVKKAMAKSSNGNMKSVATVALNNMSVPHFEDVYSSVGRSGGDASSDTASTSGDDNFDELKGYGLGEEEDLDLGDELSYRPESETAPQMPLSDDEAEPETETAFESDMSFDGGYDDPAHPRGEFDPTPQLEVDEVVPESAPSDASNTNPQVQRRPSRPFARVNTLPFRPAPPANGSILEHPEAGAAALHGPEAPLEEEIVYEDEEEDRGLKKEAYMLAEEPAAAAISKKPSKSKFSLFISRIKEKITGNETNEVEEAAAAALPVGPWKVQEERVTNKCAAVIFDWFDYWCDSCKRDGSTCAQEFDDLRTLRMSLIKERIPKSYKAGTKVITSEPFLSSPKGTAVRFAPSSSSSSSTTDYSTERPPSDLPPSPPTQTTAPTVAPAPAKRTASSLPPPALPPKPERYRGASVTTDDIKPASIPMPVVPPVTRAASAPLPSPAAVKASSSPVSPQIISPIHSNGSVPASAALKVVAPQQRPVSAAPPATAKVVAAPAKVRQTVAVTRPGNPTRKVISFKELPADADPARVEAAKAHFKRSRIAQELLETEGSYVKSLAVMVKKFQNPLLNMASSPKPLASEADIRTMFSSIEIIYSINSMLLEGLNAKLRKWSSRQTIGDVFLFMGDFLKTYSDYINHYDTSQTTVLRCMQENPRFMRFLEDMSADPACKGLGLPSLLVMPVQRVPRYSLLLKVRPNRFLQFVFGSVCCSFAGAH